MPFTFVDEKGKATSIGPPREERPGKAAARAAAVSALGTYGDIASLIPGYKPGQQTPGQEALNKAEFEASDFDLAALAGDSDVSPRYGTLPSSSQIDQLLTKYGIPKEEKTNLEQLSGRFGRLFGGGAAFGVPLGLNISTGASGAAGGQLTKMLGGGETLQNIAEFASSLRLPKKAPTPTSDKITKPRIVTKGLEGKKSGFITPDRAQKVLDKAASEAADITKTIGQDQPLFQRISKSIESGHPIQERFNNIFSDLESLAKSNNIPINNAKLDKFLADEAQRYAATGAPTELSGFIDKQIQGWLKSGQNYLYNTFRRYRLNNESIGEILATEKPSKLRNQKINFLNRMNDAIKDSFHENFASQAPTIPGSESWLNAFEETNRGYSNYINTKQAKQILDPISGKNLTDAQLNKFLNNPNTWENMDRFLGSQESAKLKTTLQDLQIVREAISTIPQKSIGAEALKAAIFTSVPGFGKLYHLSQLPKAMQWIKGRYATSPEFQETFHELAKALAEKNGPAALRAAESLKDEKKSQKISGAKKEFFVK